MINAAATHGGPGGTALDIALTGTARRALPLGTRVDPGSGLGTGAGTPNDNLTLFSFTGQALPSVGLFQGPLNVCARYDPIATPCEVPDGASS